MKSDLVWYMSNVSLVYVYFENALILLKNPSTANASAQCFCDVSFWKKIRI